MRRLIFSGSIYFVISRVFCKKKSKQFLYNDIIGFNINSFSPDIFLYEVFISVRTSLFGHIWTFWLFFLATLDFQAAVRQSGWTFFDFFVVKSFLTRFQEKSRFFRVGHWEIFRDKAILEFGRGAKRPPTSTHTLAKSSKICLNICLFQNIPSFFYYFEKNCIFQLPLRGRVRYQCKFFLMRSLTCYIL